MALFFNQGLKTDFTQNYLKTELGISDIIFFKQRLNLLR